MSYILSSLILKGYPDAVYKRFDPNHRISSVDFLFYIFLKKNSFRSFYDHVFTIIIITSCYFILKDMVLNTIVEQNFILKNITHHVY